MEVGLYTISGGSRPLDKERGSSRPLDKGEGVRSKKKFFRAFGPQFGLKIGGLGGSPGSTTDYRKL